MSDVSIERLDERGVAELLALAADEGWDPGIGDAEAFHAADPDGFYGLRSDGRLAVGLSIVRLAPAQAFLGLYIAAPPYRGRGLGLRLWTDALDRFAGTTVGLDGVVAQQANYARSGFVMHHRNVRFAGTPQPAAPPTEHVRTASVADLSALADLDTAVGGIARRRFTDIWFRADETSERTTLVVQRDDRIVAAATVRRCRAACKIGPLLVGSGATGARDARTLVDVIAHRHPGETMLLDVPAPNGAASSLAADYGLEPVFETARMYLGDPPAIDLERLFGVATFELG